MLHNFHMVQLLIMDMTWHFLWERSLLIPALKDLHFVFSHWLQEQFLSPMSIHYLCTGNLRIYVVSDILSVGYHLRYPGKCYNLEAGATWSKLKVAWGCHDVGYAVQDSEGLICFQTWAITAECGVTLDNKILGRKTSSGSHFWHSRCDTLLLIENRYDIRALPK